MHHTEGLTLCYIEHRWLSRLWDEPVLFLVMQFLCKDYPSALEPL